MSLPNYDYNASIIPILFFPNNYNAYIMLDLFISRWTWGYGVAAEFLDGCFRKIGHWRIIYCAL